jgi:hypothetical protein
MLLDEGGEQAAANASIFFADYCASWCRAQGKLQGRIFEFSMPQPIDECLSILGDSLVHQNELSSVICTFAKPNKDGEVWPQAALMLQLTATYSSRVPPLAVVLPSYLGRHCGDFISLAVRMG